MAEKNTSRLGRFGAETAQPVGMRVGQCVRADSAALDASPGYQSEPLAR
jgi:hypothetical protein